MMPFIVAICIGVSVFIGMHYSAPVLTIVFRQYGERASISANTSLTDLFIFIDPRRIIWIIVGIWILSFLLAWLVTGIPILALSISACSAYVPKYVLTLLKQRRERRFLQDLPDALLSISNMLKAGSNLQMALEIMVAESSGPIVQEFGLFLRELRMGVAFEEALDKLYLRMPVAELQLVVAGMKISREVGGSLADVLARLADTIRRRLEMEGKIKSLTAQGKLQGVVMSALPLFVGFLLYHIEPAAMGRLFTDYIGWGVCAVIVVGEYIGYRFIKKIVSIDV